MSERKQTLDYTRSYDFPQDFDRMTPEQAAEAILEAAKKFRQSAAFKAASDLAAAHGQEAKLVLTDESDDDGREISFGIIRPETDEEMKARLWREDLQRQGQEKREREQYLALKAKFEGQG